MQTVLGCSLYGMKRTLLAMNGNSKRCLTTRYVLLFPVKTCNEKYKNAINNEKIRNPFRNILIRLSFRDNTNGLLRSQIVNA